MFIPIFRLRGTPGPGKINDFTNKIFFLIREEYVQNDQFSIKTPSLYQI